MKKDQVRIGNLYTAKVSGGIAQVRITGERWLGDKHAGWKGVNTQTGRAVTIKSAQRLRAAVGGAAVGNAPAATDAGDLGHGGEGAAQAVTVAGSPKPPARAAKGDAKKAKDKSAKKGEGKPEAKKAATKNGPMSGLDAAARVLAESRKPMTCKEIVAEAFTKKYWRSEGATPEATIYAAIIREISAKGGDARFRKVGRGTFTAAKGA